MRRSALLLLAFAVLCLAHMPVHANQAPPPSVERVLRGGDVTIQPPPATPRQRTYNDTHYALYFIHVFWGFAGLLALIRSRLIVRLAMWAKRKTRWRLLHVSAVYLPYSLLVVLWHLPLSWYAYCMERDYGFSTQAPTAWLADIGKDYLVGLITIPVIWIGYTALIRSPRRWWLWLWAALIPISFVSIVIVPVYIDPMYNNFQPLRDRALATEITKLARKAGVGDAPIYEVDISQRTTKLNAYVTGLGPTKRIVLWDTLIKQLPPDQIVAIVGHELGHYALRHIWWTLWIGVAGAFVFLWLLSMLLPWTVQRFGQACGINSVTDIAGLPIAMLLVSVMMFAQTPIESAISRYEEHQADLYGLRLTRLNEASARAFSAFVRYDYSDPDPPRLIVLWLYSHPPVRERIDTALTFSPNAKQ